MERVMLGSWEHEKAAGWEYESSIFNLWRAVRNRLEIIKRTIWATFN